MVKNMVKNLIPYKVRLMVMLSPTWKASSTIGATAATSAPTFPQISRKALGSRSVVNHKKYVQYHTRKLERQL